MLQVPVTEVTTCPDVGLDPPSAMTAVQICFMDFAVVVIYFTTGRALASRWMKAMSASVPGSDCDE